MDKMKETDLAYIAGLIDGEGYIGIKKSTYKSRVIKDMVNPEYHERIQIRMVDEGAIKFIVHLFGGSYYRENPRSVKGRPLFCYQASDFKASNIVKTIYQFLKVKRRNAELIMKLRQSKEDPRAHGGNLGGRSKGKGFPMPKDIVEYRESLYQAIKAANH